MPRWLLRISGEGDSPTSLGSLCQRSGTRRAKFFPCLGGISCVPVSSHYLWPCCLASASDSSRYFMKYISIYIIYIYSLYLYPSLLFPLPSSHSLYSQEILHPLIILTALHRPCARSSSSAPKPRTGHSTAGQRKEQNQLLALPVQLLWLLEPLRFAPGSPWVGVCFCFHPIPWDLCSPSPWQVPVELKD